MEVVELTEQGLRHVVAIDLWGLVTSLNVLKDDVCAIQTSCVLRVLGLARLVNSSSISLLS